MAVDEEKISPRGRVEGRTWEATFSLPEPANAGGRPPSRGKPARKTKGNRSASKPRAKAGPKGKQAKRRPELSPAEVEAKRQDRLEYDRRRRQTPERKEQNRLHAREKRREAKAAGLCRDCRAPAIPEQTRCEACADKRRVARRKWQTERRDKDKETGTPSADKV